MEDLKITQRTIDLENVFREKNPTLARLIPVFVYAYLRRVIHEDEINDFLFRNKDYVGLDFVHAIIRDFGAIVKVSGEENVPNEGRYIIASNHPLGGLDGVALMHVVGKVWKDIVFPVNDILLFLPNLKPLFIPINKHGSNTENMEIIHKTFDSDKMMLYFPAGLVSRKQKGKIEDLEWKKTFVAKAKQYQRDVIPVHIDGNNSNFFYALANWRKRLGIKTNIEMLFLADEMFNQKNKTIHITFGKPISWQTFDKRNNFKEWAERLKYYVYSMGKGNTEPFDPETDYKQK
ncbi:MAG: 1-acyl-sn-glycerol-3-phosphate acyltransferase [Bacteroidales bacterium]|nr:1-acyl-sn-glycerol-3-phosphate acyltransferase [Bacteroidales bacterium]